MAFIKKISSHLSDQELIGQYKLNGKIEMVGELYQRYMDIVYGVCLNYLGEPEDAKDCVLNIFEELIRKLHKYEVSNFKGWLYQLTKNHCLMRLRQIKGVPQTIDISTVQLEENVHLDYDLAKEENFKLLEYCLGQLIFEQREVIELFYLQNKCYKEISDFTGLELNKVRSFIQNGRRNLKICIERQAIEQLK